MRSIDHLIQIYNRVIGDEKMVAEKIKDPSKISYFVPPLEGTNVIYAIYSLCIKQNIREAKIRFHNAASVAEFASNNLNRRVMDTGTFQISYALLSDNSELIKRYSVLKNPVNNDTSMGYQLANSMQNILLDEWEKLDWNIRGIKRFVCHSKFKWYAGVVPVLNGFRQKDAAMIELGMNELLTTHLKRNKDSFTSEFISLDTAGFNKLAWIKGYPIDMKSEFVPQELMPIKPLENYPQYKFLIDQP